MGNSQNVEVDGGAGASLIVKFIQQFSKDGRQYLKDSAVRRRGQTISISDLKIGSLSVLRLGHIKDKGSVKR